MKYKKKYQKMLEKSNDKMLKILEKLDRIDEKKIIKEIEMKFIETLKEYLAFEAKEIIFDVSMFYEEKDGAISLGLYTADEVFLYRKFQAFYIKEIAEILNEFGKLPDSDKKGIELEFKELCYLKTGSIVGKSIERIVKSKEFESVKKGENVVFTLIESEVSFEPEMVYFWNCVERNEKGIPLAKDFCGRKLAGKDFSGQDLSEADFSNADLTGANFEGSALDFADFSGANLKDADLSECNLYQVNLKGAYMDGVNLSKSTVQADMTGALVRNANCGETFFEDAVLTNTDFTNSIFKDAIIDAAASCAVFINCDFTGSDFSRTNFAAVDFTGSKLVNVTMFEGNMRDVNFNKADMTGFNGGDNIDFTHSTFEGTIMNKVNIADSNFYRCKFKKLDMREAVLFKCDMKETDFSESDLSGADLACSDVSGANFSKSKLNDSEMIRTIMCLTNFSGAELKNITYANTMLFRSDFEKLKLESEEGLIILD